VRCNRCGRAGPRELPELRRTLPEGHIISQHTQFNHHRHHHHHTTTTTPTTMPAGQRPLLPAGAMQWASPGAPLAAQTTCSRFAAVLPTVSVEGLRLRHAASLATLRRCLVRYSVCVLELPEPAGTTARCDLADVAVHLEELPIGARLRECTVALSTTASGGSSRSVHVVTQRHDHRSQLRVCRKSVTAIGGDDDDINDEAAMDSGAGTGRSAGSDTPSTGMGLDKPKPPTVRTIQMRTQCAAERLFHLLEDTSGVVLKAMSLVLGCDLDDASSEECAGGGGGGSRGGGGGGGGGGSCRQRCAFMDVFGYPAVPDIPGLERSTDACPAHEDPGLITIVKDDRPGLEVFLRGGLGDFDADFDCDGGGGDGGGGGGAGGAGGAGGGGRDTVGQQGDSSRAAGAVPNRGRIDVAGCWAPVHLQRNEVVLLLNRRLPVLVQAHHHHRCASLSSSAAASRGGTAADSATHWWCSRSKTGGHVTMMRRWGDWLGSFWGRRSSTSAATDSSATSSSSSSSSLPSSSEEGPAAATASSDMGRTTTTTTTTTAAATAGTASGGTGGLSGALAGELQPCLHRVYRLPGSPHRSSCVFEVHPSARSETCINNFQFGRRSSSSTPSVDYEK
jgi:hypothetical protein